MLFFLALKCSPAFLQCFLKMQKIPSWPLFKKHRAKLYIISNLATQDRAMITLILEMDIFMLYLSTVSNYHIAPILVIYLAFIK